MTREQPPTDELKEAYRLAIAARDLEIAQLVQRNNFFMIFQGVLLAGLVQASGSGKITPVVAFLVCLAGFLISLCQLFMAAGAKFWVERWESAVETVEKKLYPTDDDFRVFSCSRNKINGIVENRMKGKCVVGWFVTFPSKFTSPSRLPIYAALIFAGTWLFLWLCTFRVPCVSLAVPSWITGFTECLAPHFSGCAVSTP